MTSNPATESPHRGPRTGTGSSRTGPGSTSRRGGGTLRREQKQRVERINKVGGTLPIPIRKARRATLPAGVKNFGTRHQLASATVSKSSSYSSDLTDPIEEPSEFDQQPEVGDQNAGKHTVMDDGVPMKFIRVSSDYGPESARDYGVSHSRRNSTSQRKKRKKRSRRSSVSSTTSSHKQRADELLTGDFSVDDDSDHSDQQPHPDNDSSGSESIGHTYDDSHEAASARIQVAIRIRPLLEREIKMRDRMTTRVEAEKTQVHIAEKTIAALERRKSRKDIGYKVTETPLETGMSFTFDKVFDTGDTQEMVYNMSAKSIVNQVLRGYHGCIFCYGQTGSGKTHTMLGNVDEPGITYRAAEHIQYYIQDKSDSIDIEVSVSFLEIYNNSLIDLLIPRASRTAPATTSAAVMTQLKIREDPTRGVFVHGLSVRDVMSVEDVHAVITEGFTRRTTAPTKMNEVSSRSHAVLTFYVRQQQRGDTDGITNMESRMNLIDLAGSERLHQTGAAGVRAREGAMINQSLSALGNVIESLVLHRRHVPYRDATLTRLLQDSLGGNSLTLIIGNISPGSGAYAESVSTLRFVDRAKQIKNKPVMNMDPMVRRIKELQGEVNRLTKLMTTCYHCGSDMKAFCGVCENQIDIHFGEFDESKGLDALDEELKAKEDPRMTAIRELLKNRTDYQTDDPVYAIQMLIKDRERQAAQSQSIANAVGRNGKGGPGSGSPSKPGFQIPGGGGHAWIDANHMFFFMTALACKMTAPPHCTGRKIPTTVLYKEAMRQKVPFQYYKDWITHQIYRVKALAPKAKPPPNTPATSSRVLNAHGVPVALKADRLVSGAIQNTSYNVATSGASARLNLPSSAGGSSMPQRFQQPMASSSSAAAVRRGGTASSNPTDRSASSESHVTY
jgi:Kinesin motor domain